MVCSIFRDEQCLSPQSVNARCFSLLFVNIIRKTRGYADYALAFLERTTKTHAISLMWFYFMSSSIIIDFRIYNMLCPCIIIYIKKLLI